MTFEELLQEYEVPIAPQGHHHAREGWIQFDCPFCGENSLKYHMGYSIQDQFTNCWNCGHHSIPLTIVALTKEPWDTVCNLLKQLKFQNVIRREHKIRAKLKLPPTQRNLHDLHRNYLARRLYDPDEIVRLWGVKSITIAARLQWRLFIPIHLHGQIVSWTTRGLDRTDPPVAKYISASRTEEAVFHKTLLYGEDFCRHSIIIMEGPLDVWRYGPGAVATFGTSVTPQQVHRMSRYPTRVICFDNEPDAQERARKLQRRLAMFPGETIRFELDSKDPGEMTYREQDKLWSLANL